MVRITSNSARKARGKPFQPGNKYGKGRPQGSQNKATMVLHVLLEGQGEAIMRKAVEMALAGDRSALRLCIERLIPPAKERTLSLKLPELSTAQGMSAAIERILGAALEGELTLTEAQGLVSMLEVQRKVIETCEMESKIRQLQIRAGVKSRARLDRLDAILPTRTPLQKRVQGEVLHRLDFSERLLLLALIDAKDAGQELPRTPEQDALWNKLSKLQKIVAKELIVAEVTTSAEPAEVEKGSSPNSASSLRRID